MNSLALRANIKTQDSVEWFILTFSPNLANFIDVVLRVGCVGYFPPCPLGTSPLGPADLYFAGCCFKHASFWRNSSSKRAFIHFGERK